MRKHEFQGKGIEKDMSFINDQFNDWLMQDAFGFHDEDEQYYDDSFLLAERQKPHTPGGVDWRYEKGGVYYND